MLKNILLNYSRRNVTVGYCQGFNFIAGRLIKILENEEYAFWVFVMIIEKYLPLNTYSDASGVMIDSVITRTLIKINCEKVSNHLTDNDLDLSLNSTLYKWYTGLFSVGLSEEVFFLIRLVYVFGIISFCKEI